MAAPVQHIGVGRRKTSVARVYLRPGKGEIKINHRGIESYFPLPWRRSMVMSPLEVTNMTGQYDIVANVRGGGLTGQAEAIQLGIARALLQVNEEYRGVLRSKDLLTRDPRAVERKKYGQPKARKRFQFSKR